MKNIALCVMLGLIGGNIFYNSYVVDALKPIEYARAQEAPKEVLIEVKIDWTKERIKQEIEEQGIKYGVSTSTLNAVINCESQYNRYALGDSNHSRGLVQIHNSFHPEITDEEAYDPRFAIGFLAKNLKAGNGNLWSCYRNM